MHEMMWIKWANQIFNTKLNQTSVLLLFGLHNRNGTELGFHCSADCLTNMMRMQTINNNNNKSNDCVYFAVIWTWSWLHLLILFCFVLIRFDLCTPWNLDLFWCWDLFFLYNFLCIFAIFSFLPTHKSTLVFAQSLRPISHLTSQLYRANYSHLVHFNESAAYII